MANGALTVKLYEAKERMLRSSCSLSPPRVSLTALNVCVRCISACSSLFSSRVTRPIRDTSNGLRLMILAAQENWSTMLQSESWVRSAPVVYLYFNHEFHNVDVMVGLERRYIGGA